MALQRGQRVKVQIDRLSVGGRGVARHDGFVIFVPDTAPRETVEIEIDFIKAKYAEAHLVAVDQASSARVIPHCPVAGVCGGCNWQHVSYIEQLLQKRELVRESIRRFSGFDVSLPESVREVVASPQEWRYRNRIQLHHFKNHLGFFKRGSHEIIDIADCPISDERLTKTFADLRQEFSHQPPGRIEIYLSKNGRVEKRGSQNQDKEEGGLAFSQVNSEQNELLVNDVVDLLVQELAHDTKDPIYDLYSGNGNFTLPLARAFPLARIGSAELSRENVEHARAAFQAEFPDRKAKMAHSDVLEFLKTEKISRESVILLDPPRTGCAPEVTRAICTARPKVVVYVSCHPVTLARDLKTYRETGYRLADVRPFDMFPQTDHVETVALLKL